MSNYVTKEELKASLELTGTSFADGDIPRAVAAASRAVDGICNRRFYQDTEDKSRFFNLTDRIIAIDDLSVLTSAAVATAVGQYNTIGTNGLDFAVEPLNAAADDHPYTMFRALDWWPSNRYCRGASTPYGNLKITGRWGWPEIPDQVPQATSIIAAKFVIRTRQAPFGIVTAGADVGVAMRIGREDPDVCLLLDELTREDLVF